MSLANKVDQLLKEDESKRLESPNYQKIKDRLEKLESLGLVNKPSYSIPQVDTIGKQMYESSSQRVRTQL